MVDSYNMKFRKKVDNRTCELKVCSTKKPDNPTVLLALPAVPELSALCIIQTSSLKGGKVFPEIMPACRLRGPSSGRDPLVTDLVGTYLSNKVDGKVLQNTFNPEPITVEPDDGQRIQRQAGACQDTLAAIHLHQHESQLLI